MTDPKYKNIGEPPTRTIEECSELIQALCKAERFGWFNFHPRRPESINVKEVEAEIDDVIVSCEKLRVYIKDVIRK